MFEQNDLVTLKSDKKKIVYYIKKIEEQHVLLIGYIYRIKKTSDIDNIEYADKTLIEQENKILEKLFEQTVKQQKRIHKVIFGTILHIDSDKKFLDSCLNLYKEMKIHAWGAHIKEKDIRLFHRLRRGIMGTAMNLPGKGGRKISVAAYRLSQKIVGFN